MSSDMLITGLAYPLFKTGNMYADTLMLCVVMAVMPIIVKQVKRMKIGGYLSTLASKFGFVDKEYKYSVSLICLEGLGTWRAKLESSYNHRAVSYYLVEEKYTSIHHLKENYSTFCHTFGEEYEDDDEKTGIYSKYPYTVITKRDIHIENGIYFRVVETDVDGGERGDHVRIRMKQYCLLLMSDNDNGLYDIKNFIKKCATMFKQYLHDKQNNSKMRIFGFKKVSDGILECVEDDADIVGETLETSIFDHHKSVSNAVNKFVNDAYYAKHPSLSRKLTCLFLGDTGTGKTHVGRLIAKHSIDIP